MVRVGEEWEECWATKWITPSAEIYDAFLEISMDRKRLQLNLSSLVLINFDECCTYYFCTMPEWYKTLPLSITVQK